MTRDEWMVLPNGERLRRSSVWSYYEKSTALGWTYVEVAHGGVSRTLDFLIPLAEFEALLFGPAEGDEYTRAAAACAEAEVAYRDYRLGRPGAVKDEAVAGNKAYDAFLALYRKREAARSAAITPESR